MRVTAHRIVAGGPAEGERVRFCVSSDVADTVIVRSYEISKPVEAGDTILLDFETDLVGCPRTVPRPVQGDERALPRRLDAQLTLH